MKPKKQINTQSDKKLFLKFNTKFNALHHRITEILDVSEKHDFWLCLSEIKKRAKSSSFFASIDDMYYDELRTLNTIRNLVVHTNEWIEIQPKTIATIDAINQKIDTLESHFHTKAIEIFRKKVFSTSDADTLKTIVEAMSIRNFSHVPIYSEKWEFRWVFSNKSLLLWIQNNPNNHINTDTLLKDIAIDTKKREYIFIKNSTPVAQVEHFFREYSQKRQKLWAIFLTKSWKSSDTIEGIITAWDLPMIGEGGS